MSRGGSGSSRYCNIVVVSLVWSPGRRLFAPTIVFPPYHLLTWVLVEHARRFTVVVNFEDIDILRLAGRAGA
jgi:hypothetical protein